MCKKLLKSVIIISLVILVSLFLLGHYSRNQTAKQPAPGQLAPCPETMNCVCSEYPQDLRHYIEAIDLSGKAQVIDLSIITPIITEMGGEIVVQQKDYLSATFESRVFGFIDDFELRLDQVNERLQLRSASRVGRSDLGVNKLRAQVFKKEFLSRFQPRRGENHG